MAAIAVGQIERHVNECSQMHQPTHYRCTVSRRVSKTAPPVTINALDNTKSLPACHQQHQWSPYHLLSTLQNDVWWLCLLLLLLLCSREGGILQSFKINYRQWRQRRRCSDNNCMAGNIISLCVPDFNWPQRFNSLRNDTFGPPAGCPRSLEINGHGNLITEAIIR